MKKLLLLAALCCFAGIFASCQKNQDEATTEKNPVAGTSWEWSDEYVKWTFTFSEKEVVFKYESSDTTDEYKSTYTYKDNQVFFTMNGWSGIVWQYIGTIEGDTMHLKDGGTEKIDIYLTKK